MKREAEELNEQVSENDIRALFISIARLETKIDQMANTREVAADAKQLALKAEQSAEVAYNRADNAHVRLDKVDKLVFWLGTTVVGSLLVGGISLLFKFAGGGK